LFPFASLYIAFGATFGLLGSAAPLIFRARGMPLAEVGLLQIMYLPIGLSFLWASLLDQIKLPGLPLRVGWIVAGEVATVGLVLLLSLGEHWPVAILMVLALGTSMATATMDISLEALVVQTVPRERRPLVTTAKLCGSSIGGTIGISLATMFPSVIGLPQALLIVGGLDALLLLPILRYPETQYSLKVRLDTQRQTRILKRLRGIAGRAVALGLYFAAALMIGESSTLVLVDLHLPLPVVGFVTGTLTSVLTVAMTLTSGALTMRFATDRLVAALAVAVLLGGCMTLVATAWEAPWLGVAAAIVNIVATAGLGVPIFTMIYRWAEGAGAATDYALLFGCAFLTSLPARLGAPALAGAIGWTRYFSLCIPLYAASILLM
jgi:hypothetical protein